MSNYLLRTLAESEGFCCEIKWMREFAPLENREVAAKIGVHRKTIAKTRNKIRRCELTCPGTCKNLARFYELCVKRAEAIVRDPSFIRPAHIPSASAKEHITRELWLARFREYAEEKTGEDPGYLKALSAYRIFAKPHSPA